MSEIKKILKNDFNFVQQSNDDVWSDAFNSLNKMYTV